MRKKTRAVGAAVVLLSTLAVAAPAAVPIAALPQAIAATGDCAPGTDWGTTRDDLAARVIELVNEHRLARGLGALEPATALTSAGVWKARHMAYYGYIQHDDPAPPLARTVSERLEACGYPANSGGWGENIAYGYATAEAVMQGWLDSTGHRENIENTSFRTIGVGVAVSSDGAIYWVQAFGTTGSSSDASPQHAPPPPPPPTIVTAVPGTTTVFSGVAVTGDVGALTADDESYYGIASATGTNSWYGRIYGVPNTLRALRVAFRGLSTEGCAHWLAIWNWTRGYWLVLDMRSLNAVETAVTTGVAGTLEEYVSGSSGGGDVAILSHCMRSDGLAFTTSGDLMKIEYEN